jgi:predicted transcriptional regulator
MDKKETSDFLCHMLNVRLNDEENLRFQRLAEHLQTTRSRLLRKMIREAIGAPPDLLPQEWKLFEDLAYQLAAIGRNFNQLVRAINSGKVSVTADDQAAIEAVRAEVSRVDEAVVTIIDRSCNRWVKDARR